MAATPPIPSRSGTARLRKQRQPRPLSPVKNMVLLLAIVVVFAIGLALTTHGKEFLSNLYRPVAIAFVILLAIEYIALKGRDRSRIYKIELEQARTKRQQDLEFLRGMEKELTTIEEKIRSMTKSPSGAIGSVSGAPSPSDLAEIQERLSALRRSLSERL
jgi:hypothetical protein